MANEIVQRASQYVLNVADPGSTASKFAVFTGANNLLGYRTGNEVVSDISPVLSSISLQGYTIGDLIYASGSTAFSRLADVATGSVLISGGVATAPSWGKVNLTTAISGILPAANGGTSFGSYNQGDIIYASGTTALGQLAKDTNATRYLSNTGTSNNPAWSQVNLGNGVSGTLPISSGGTGAAAAYTAKDNLSLKGADIPSAGTTDLSTATGDFVFITGTSTITALGTATAGIERTVKFTGALILTYNSSSLILPGAANITTVAGDTAVFRSLGSGNWICIDYVRSTNVPGTTPLSSLSAATTTNTIDSLTNAQIWNWSTASTQSPLIINANSLTSGSILGLSTTNNSLNSTLGLLYVTASGTSTNGALAFFQSNGTNTNLGLTIMTSGRVGVGTKTPNALLHLAGPIPLPNNTTAGMLLSVNGALTDNSTANSGTVTHTAISSFNIPSIASTGTSVTYTAASTLYIAGAPSAGTNITITTPYSLYIADGLVNFAGTTATTGAVQNRVVIQESLTSGTVGAGFGSGILFQGTANNGGSPSVLRDMMNIQTFWSTATDGSRTAKFAVQLVNNTAALTTMMDLVPGTLSIYDNGGANGATFAPTASGLTITDAAGLTFSTNGSSASAVNFSLGNAQGGVTITGSSTGSFTQTCLTIAPGFTQTSSQNNAKTYISLAGTFNQTNGTGVIHLIDISPTITALNTALSAVYIGTNNANFVGINQQGSSTYNLFGGKTMFGTTTLVGSNILYVSGQTQIDLGSDASYDLFYRGPSGNLLRVANGTTGQFFVSTTNAAPSWTSSITATALRLDQITAANTTATIDSLNNAIVWNWSTANTQTPLTINANGLTSGSIISLATTNGSLNSTNGLFSVFNNSASVTGVLAKFQSNSTSGTGLYVFTNNTVTIGTSAAAASTILTTKGTSNANATFGYIHQNSGTTTVFSVADDGTTSIGSSTPVVLTNATFTTATGYTIGNSSNLLTIGGSSGGIIISTSSVSSTAIAVTLSGAGGGLSVDNTSVSNSGSYILRVGNTTNTSSNVVAGIVINNGINVSSGAGSLTALSITTPVIATSTSSGIQRGILINPSSLVVVAGAPYRGIDLPYSTVNTFGIYQGGTSPNIIAGKTSFGSTTSPTAFLTLGGANNFGGAAIGITGILLSEPTNTTYTDTATAGSGTVAHVALNGIGIPIYNATNSSITYTSGSSLYIAGSPSSSANVTITNPYAIYVASGNTYLGSKAAVGAVLFGSNVFYVSGQTQIDLGSDATNDLFYRGPSGNLLRLANAASGNALISTTNSAPSWGKIGLTTHVTGVLPIANGGTNASTGYGAQDNLSLKSTDIASAGTTDLSTTTGDFAFITGTSTITSLGTTTAGVERTVKFGGILTLTYNATSLILPGAANITTSAGDTAIFRSLGSGNWICINYTSAVLSPTANQWASVASYVAINGGTALAALSALNTHYATSGGEIVVDAAVSVTADTTVSAKTRVVDGGSFAISTTKTLTLNGDFTCSPSKNIFTWTSTGTVVFSQKAVPEIYPYWFGAIADASTDCKTACQKAIDVAIASKVKRVKFLNGDHLLSNGLVIQNGSSVVTLELLGNLAFDSGGAGTSLLMSGSTDFCIGIQGSRDCAVRGFYIRGAGYTYNPTLAQIIQNSEGTWGSNYGRQDRYSPFAAVVIDPFSTSAPTGGGYPNFSSRYSGSLSLSTEVHIEDCTIRYFIAGIVVSPSGVDGNGSELKINRVSMDRCQIGVAPCGTQNRQVNITNSVLASMQVCVHCAKYGPQNAPLPIITQTEMGSCRDLIWANNGGGSGVITDMYSESVYRIGLWSGANSPLMFINCQINFTTQPETGVNDAASVLDALQSTVSFIGGNMSYSTYRPVETFCQMITLEDVTINAPIINQPNGGLYEESVFYKNCKMQGYGGQYNLISFQDDIQSVDATQFSSPLVTRGQKIKFYETGLGYTNYAVYENDIDATKKITLMDAPTVTISGTTATFTSVFAGKYRLGDILYSYNNNSTATPSGNSKACTWGIVTNVSGTSITCSYVASGVSTGSYAIYLYEFKRFVPTCVGSITAGTTTLTIATASTQTTVANLWPVGTRIYTDTTNQGYNYGMYNGLYVASVSGNTITVSGNVGITYTNAEFFCFPMKCTYYSYDGTYQIGSTTYRTVGYRTGDKIIFVNHAYRAYADVTAGGFTPTVNMTFKKISGTTGSRPSPAAIDVGLTYYNTTTNTQQWWDGTTWHDTVWNECYIEGQTGTTFDLDANTGIVKDIDGNNIAFTMPANLASMFVFRNGTRINRTGTGTTRDYSVNTSTNVITLVSGLATNEQLYITKDN